MAWIAVGGVARAQSLPTVAFLNESDERTAEGHVELSTKEGHVSLEWHCDVDGKGVIYELQSARDLDFTDPLVRFHGADTVSFLSGLDEDAYYFRVRGRLADGDENAWGPWSEPVHLSCDHHSMTLAWTLFGVGGFLFLSIAAFVISNSWNLDRIEALDA